MSTQVYASRKPASKSRIAHAVGKGGTHTCIYGAAAAPFAVWAIQEAGN